MSAASPGVVAVFFRNDHYPSEEAYLYAIADAMRHEYEAIAKAGFVLQIDCPDLAMGKHIKYHDVDLKTFRKAAQLNIEAMNHAVANIPAEQLRMHVCWGNYEGPHHYDVPLADVIDLVFKAKPSAISFEAANPRHAHEWTLFETVKLPDGKVLIPGVIESKANFIEHPELIAQRIGRYAKLVGRENVMAGSDCGYGTWVGQAAVDPGRGVGEDGRARRRRAHRDEGVLEGRAALRLGRPHAALWPWPRHRARLALATLRQRERIACLGREALGFGQTKLLAHDVGAEHHRDHLVGGVAAAHALAAHAAVGRDDQPFRRNVLQRLADQRRDLVRPLDLQRVMVDHADDDLLVLDRPRRWPSGRRCRTSRSRT